MEEIKKSVNKHYENVFCNSNSGASSVLSIAILIAITILIGLLFLSYLNSSDFFNFSSTCKNVKIDIISSEGGLRYDSPPVRFSENKIVLNHSGGDNLNTNNVEILITGFGNTFSGIPGESGSGLIVDNISVYYKNISFSGKNSSYETLNNNLKDGIWSAGEFLYLSGNDSCPGECDSGVFVLTSSETTYSGKISGNYGFKSGSRINLYIFYNESGERILLSEKEFSLNRKI